MGNRLSEIISEAAATVLALILLAALLAAFGKIPRIIELTRVNSIEKDIAAMKSGGGYYNEDYLARYTEEEVAMQISEIESGVTVTVNGAPYASGMKFYDIIQTLADGEYKVEYTSDGSGKVTAVEYTYIY